MGNVLSAYKQVEHEVKLQGSRGSIKGLQFDDKSRRYLGLPYALPPTGPLRWRKPQPLPESYRYCSPDGTAYDATQFGPICLQPQYSPHIKNIDPAKTYSEDCLRLNIWTPVVDEEHAKLPVYMWLHGGWFQIGDPHHEDRMDPTELLSTGNFKAVFVAVGYRINIFGFLSGNASDTGDVGNYGLWDQRMALEWIYHNIAAFGGDPENITLSGRSAGAYSVEAQTLYDFQKEASPPLPKALFRQIIMISNAIPAQPKAPKDCRPQFDEVCAHFNVPEHLSDPEKLNLLRDIDGATITAAIMKFKNHSFRPVTDNVFIKPGLAEYIQEGSFAEEFKSRKMKLFIGEALNEETLYGATNSPTDAASLHLQVSNYYAPETTKRVLEQYTLPTSNDPASWETLFGRIIADGQVCAPSRVLTNSLVTHGVPVSDVWRYLFAYRLSFITEEMAHPRFGIAHAMDRPFWNFSIMHGPGSKEQKLMQQWIDHLSKFVTRDPDFNYGASEADEHKVITGDGRLEIQKDPRWNELLRLGYVFSGRQT